MKVKEIRCYEDESGQIHLDLLCKSILDNRSIVRAPGDTLKADITACQEGKLSWGRWNDIERHGTRTLLAVWEDGHAHMNWIPGTENGKAYLGINPEDMSIRAGDNLF